MSEDTLPEPAASTAVATTHSDAPEGLEDFETSDMVMPRLSINHNEAKFEDNLSGAMYDEIDVILLGLMKQRVLWPAEPGGEGERPMCKSFDFKAGIPNPDSFPTRAAGVSEAEVEAGVLECASCPLKEWGSHPQRETPWCSEQHTFALLLPMAEDDEFGAPALLTVQRSAIKPSKQYLTSFARSRTPLYTVRTKISLDARRRGSVDFAVPKFIKSGGTDSEMWPEFASQYRMIREFVTTPTTFDDEGGDDEATPTPAPTTDEPKAKSAPAAAPAEEDDDLPF